MKKKTKKILTELKVMFKLFNKLKIIFKYKK